MNEMEKEELFAEFCIRMAEMDTADKKLAAAKNRSAMKKVSEYWIKHIWGPAGMGRGAEDGHEWMAAYDEEGRKFFNYWGIYDAYIKIRGVIPLLVNIKKYARIKEGYPRNYDKRRIFEMDPKTDVDEAYKCGKIMLDAMIKYLKEDTAE